ncbi:MAG: hypothetical protein FWC41_09435, partial [Firmicutes bacterium]|nr:hypothetical protein [Bacillota bacterium]
NILNYKSNHSVLFHYTAVDFSNQVSYINYITWLLSRFTTLKLASEKEILSTGLDIPFYHFLKYPELYFLLLYAWNNTINRKLISYSNFCENLEKNGIVSIYNEIYNAYISIPSKEIWTTQSIDTILRLLEHYYETGAFGGKETVLFLLDQLTNLLDTVKRYADNGYKECKSKIPFSLYVCSVDLENNFILTRRDNHLSCHVKLYTINCMSTDDEFFCSEATKLIDDLISKSTLISGASVKERLRFFQSANNKIDILRNKIELS